MLEREIEKIFVSEVRRAGGRAYKFNSPGNDGVPDRLVCFPGGKICFVELKTDRGRPTSLQRVQIRRLRDFGQSVFVVRGIEGVSEWFNDMRFPEIAKSINAKYLRKVLEGKA